LVLSPSGTHQPDFDCRRSPWRESGSVM